MRKRAEQVEHTRQRIVDAAVRLHSTVGPAHTTISAVAEHADVTRLTVYRHFPDPDTLFDACSREWARRHPGPDPAAWRAIADPHQRVQVALAELYGWYGQVGHQLLRIVRDVEAMPPGTREATEQHFTALADALVHRSRARGVARRRLRAAAGHVVSVWTWHSLAVEQHLGDAEAAKLAASLLDAVARTVAQR